MPTITTVFRATVMLVAAVLIVKGWQSYGPSTVQLKTLASRALVLAQERLDQSPAAAPTAEGWAGEELQIAASTTDAAPTLPAEGRLPDAPASSVTAEIPTGPPALSLPPEDERLTPASDGATPNSAPIDAERLAALMQKLKQLGGREPKLATWGSNRQLYRFCCRAARGDSQLVSRHFESVSAEPLVAVEDVVAKVSAWRAAELTENGWMQ